MNLFKYNNRVKVYGFKNSYFIRSGKFHQIQIDVLILLTKNIASVQYMIFYEKYAHLNNLIWILDIKSHSIYGYMPTSVYKNFAVRYTNYFKFFYFKISEYFEWRHNNLKEDLLVFSLHKNFNTGGSKVFFGFNVIVVIYF